MTANGAAPDECGYKAWPPQHVREARRMISDYVLTESDVLEKIRSKILLGWVLLKWIHTSVKNNKNIGL